MYFRSQSIFPISTFLHWQPIKTVVLPLTPTCVTVSNFHKDVHGKAQTLARSIILETMSQRECWLACFWPWRAPEACEPAGVQTNSFISSLSPATYTPDWRNIKPGTWPQALFCDQEHLRNRHLPAGPINNTIPLTWCLDSFSCGRAPVLVPCPTFQLP